MSPRSLQWSNDGDHQHSAVFDGVEYTVGHRFTQTGQREGWGLWIDFNMTEAGLEVVGEIQGPFPTAARAKAAALEHSRAYRIRN